LRPVTLGFHNDWVGVVTQLSDDDPSSGMTTILANQSETVNLSAYVGADNMSSVAIATLAVAGVGAPQNMKHLVRMSGVDYEHPTLHALAPTLQYNISDFQENPGTSLPWTSTDIAAAFEIGFTSKV
jgi:hypothetical protein